MGVGYWPPEVPREETVPAFEGALAQLGFKPCSTRTPEKGVEKVALFALQDKPTHVAKLLAKGKWSSKLGQFEDIEHNRIRLQFLPKQCSPLAYAVALLLV